MGLPALEFSDCYLDSPQFRERLKSHELELEKTNKFIKELIKDGKTLIQALRSLSTAKRKFAESLNQFKFQCIGDAETDDEMCIGKQASYANPVIIPFLLFYTSRPASRSPQEAKKKYDKETEKYCGFLEKHLSLSSKKKESQLIEADSQVDQVRQHFYEVSLEYVFKVQEVQERKMFEFVEPLLAFLQGLFTYYHHGYDLAKDFSHFKTNLTISIQNTRNRFESTRAEVESLMEKMKENPHEHKNVSPHTMEGYLFVQEKRSFVSTWVKYYCTYQRESRRVTMVPFDQKSGGKAEDVFTLKSCTRRKTESIEKRFCLDLEAVDRSGVITMQALSEEDRRLWMEAMDGREPVGSLGTLLLGEPKPSSLFLQGLYRIVGVNSRVQKLLSLAMDPKTCADVELDNSEWEIKTITSALKYYLRMLPTPLMTYQLQRNFIQAAKLDNPEARILEVQSLVHRLPEKNRQMLELLMKHLANVASHHQENLMTVANLGVVFGPTLLRPQEETVAAIMDIKFQNVVVEILIENHERIFNELPVPGEGQQNPSLPWKRSAENKTPSCSERPLTLFHMPQSTEKGEMSPGTPGFPQAAQNSLPHLESSVWKPTVLCPRSSSGRKARALYACKAEHESELSFSTGAMFENVHPSREPGWLEGSLDGRTGLIPENYVEFL
uniref:Rho GTPase activating protein 26 n=1 Tax=Scleropages formosus TaxID=113540 RepID=A0A8C9VJ32_SCLFO